METRLLGNTYTLTKSRHRGPNTRGIPAYHHRIDETLSVRDRNHPEVRTIKEGSTSRTFRFWKES
jgi:hypothetical protein